MNRTPRNPPIMAKAPILKIPGLNPHMKSAGMVKIMPEASDELAEPVVWAILQSKMVLFPKTGVSALKTATAMTAKGIAVEMVKPTLSPK